MGTFGADSGPDSVHQLLDFSMFIKRRPLVMRTDCFPPCRQRPHPAERYCRGSVAGLCAPLPSFAYVLAGASARLGTDVVRYTFIAVDLHHLLLAGLPAHPT